jgi:2-methylcitrate dehydratase PrpD
MTYLEAVSDYIVSIEYQNIPEDVLRKIKASVLYALVMGLTGHDEDDTFWKGLGLIHPEVGEASLLVSGAPRSAADAAFINAALICVRGQNDTFTQAVAHPGCVAIPAVLAVAERIGSGGRAILTSLVAGYEVLAKLGAPAANQAVGRGFRATSVFGVFASAAAVARLLGLDRIQTAHALSIASQFAAGTMQCWEEGTPEWRLQIGNASRAGVLAAFAARNGLTASAQALEGKSGFYHCFCGSVPTLDLSGWATPALVYKPFPGCLINQGPIHVLRAILGQQHIAPAAVRQVVVRLSPQNANYPGVANHGPFVQQTGAVMSGPFMLEVILREGALRQEHFETLYGEDPIHAASARVVVQADAALPTWGCAVTVHLDDGRSFEERIEDQSCFAYGWDEVVAVLDMLVEEWPFADAATRYAAMKRLVDGFEREAGVDALMRLCVKEK